MTRTELNALRAKYAQAVPANFIKGAFFSKTELLTLLNKHDDCSGLFLSIIPSSKHEGLYSIHAEPYNVMKQPYPEDEGTRGLDGGIGSESFGPCPPEDWCPPGGN
jgi:hypothetical protein